MRYDSVPVYKFEELDDSAKERAKNAYAANIGYAWSSEAMASLTALTEKLGGRMTNWQIDWFEASYSSAEFDMPELDEADLQAIVDFLGPGKGDCVLTGYCADEDAIDGLRAAYLKGERDPQKLMQAAFRTWLKAAQSDCAAQYTDEAFGEHCEANGYEFYGNGSFYPR